MIPADLVCEQMERFGVPGVAVGVLHGEVEQSAGFGVTSVDHSLQVDADTLFQIGSVSKTYTATAAMRLVEAGRLDLDEPVVTYLGELRLADPAVARAVTMRHLLTHTGGWVGDYFASIGPGDDALAVMVGRLERLEQLTPLGAIWSYNNAGYYLAGHVIEVIAGKPFEAAVQELVLDPLGLESSFFFADDVITRRFAVGHHGDGEVALPWSIGRPAAPAGGIIASVRDVLKYARALWDSQGFLSLESTAELCRPHVPTSGGDNANWSGLGWQIVERGGKTFVLHDGATNGQVAFLIACPEERFALTSLTNHGDGGAVNREIMVAILRRALGVEIAAETRRERFDGELAEYAGRYESMPLDATVTVEDGGLTIALTPKTGFPESDAPPRPGPPPIRLAFEGSDVVVASDGPAAGMRADFIRTADGRVDWLRWGGRVLRRVNA